MSNPVSISIALATCVGSSFVGSWIWLTELAKRGKQEEIKR